MFTYLIFEIISAIIGTVAVIVLLVHLAKMPTIHNVLKRRGIIFPLFYLLSLFSQALSQTGHILQILPCLCLCIHMHQADSPLICHSIIF